MAECPKFEHLLVIPKVRVQNANAISSSLTHGFPAITAFLGLMWALERKMAALELDLRFKAVGVVCHDYQEQITREGSHTHTFCLTRNPLIIKEGKVASAPIVEEGRIHLEISLIFAFQSGRLTNEFVSPEVLEKIAADVFEVLENMHIAGGSILYASFMPSRQRPYIVSLTGTKQDCVQCFQQLKYRLLPGFALVARDDLLEERYMTLRAENPETSRLDAWLSLSRINARYTEQAGWEDDRNGWIVPIPVGYSVLSGPHEPGTVSSARDDNVPFCFVESVYSIGQWLSPHRLQSPQQLLWYAASNPLLYRCHNDFRISLPEQEDYDFD
ncbi:MAG: type I-F CRISPR-associated protein Csy2 [Azoarcus sp.]|jgi:CRISPR-associated protein Csy2|nr:type I-F CRISPR-associated protein Csy2 [Azoarcus sp.]